MKDYAQAVSLEHGRCFRIVDDDDGKPDHCPEPIVANGWLQVGDRYASLGPGFLVRVTRRPALQHATIVVCRAPAPRRSDRRGPLITRRSSTFSASSPQPVARCSEHGHHVRRGHRSRLLWSPRAPARPSGPGWQSTWGAVPSAWPFAPTDVAAVWAVSCWHRWLERAR